MASSILRIIIGLALVVAALSAHSKYSTQISAGGDVRIFGISAGSTGWLVPAFLVVGAIGLLFVILGIVRILKSRR
jgi:hypothetical protein